MSNVHFDVNIDADLVVQQYEMESYQSTTPNKTQFDAKNYLNARLQPNETSKTLTIRLLPFSSTEPSPFHKVYMHNVRVNKELAPSGWKRFVCPTHNKKDGAPMGNACPFCETAAKARELKQKSLDEPTRKKYGDVEFANRVSEMWVVRCIERGHEEDGVKFWLFGASKKRDGVFDKIMNLANQRAASALKKGNKYSIFDLNNGEDLIVTITRTSDNKTSIQIIDEGFPSPLTEDYDLGMKWINDEKKWYEVYTLKPYNYMSIVAAGGVPVYDKDLGKLVDKKELAAVKAEAKQEAINEKLMEPKRDFSQVAANTGGIEIIDGNSVGDTSTDDGKDLPF